MLENKMIALVVSSINLISTSNYIVNSLKAIGYRVVVCSDFDYGQDSIKAHGAIDVNNLCLKHGISPQIVLFIEGGTMQVLPIGLESLSCISAWYGIDTHMDYGKHLNISKLFDVTFVAQKEYVSQLHADGIKQVYWLPLAFSHELLPVTKQDRDIDISYVGSNNVNINPHRHKLLSALKARFESTKFGLASPKEMGEIYSRSKIVFNKSVKNDINMRFFEAMGCGAVLVTDPIINNGLEDLFEENKHYVVYNNDDELISKIEMLLIDNNLLEKISQNARQLVLEKHTYQARTETVLDICSKSKKIGNPNPTDYFAALLALKLYGPALYQCAVAFKNPSNSGFRKYISLIIGFFLVCLSKIVNFVEQLINAVKK